VNIVSAPIISSYLKQFTTSQEMKITDTSPAQGLEEHWREIQRGIRTGVSTGARTLILSIFPRYWLRQLNG
jgi:hypothetical protein